MSDVTPKQIRDAVQATSLGCPCCGARLHMVVEPMMRSADKERVAKAITEGLIRLATVEDAEEHMRNRDKPFSQWAKREYCNGEG